MIFRNIPIGDQTLSALEIWGAEYQENDCFLCTEEDLPMVLQFAKRENCPMGAVGKVTNYFGRQSAAYRNEFEGL